MSIHISEFAPDKYNDNGKLIKENKSQKMFLESFFRDVLPKSYTDMQIVVLSGAMGSGKSAGAEFIISLLAMQHADLKIGLGRMSVKEIQETFFKELKIMIPSEAVSRDTTESIELINGTTINCRGWGDGNVRKIRANNYHIFVMEEVTEDAGKNGTINLNKYALREIVGRTRNPGGPNLIFLITNPDDPIHWLYQDYIQNAGYVNGNKTSVQNREDNIHVYYSVTTDNPYLQEAYKHNLAKNNTPAGAERYINGKWVSIAGNGIYNEYDETKHYRSTEIYKINDSIPEILTWDFNTAAGKPMSAAMAQFVNDTFHIFDEVVIEDSNTRGVLIELESRGYFKKFTGGKKLLIMGDSAGYQSHSAGDFNDYSLMEKFLNGLPYPVNYDILVPSENPEVKARHALVNLYLNNLLNESRIVIYAPAHSPSSISTVHKGLKTVRLKAGNVYKEQETYEQHITTAIGYALWYCVNYSDNGPTVLKF